MAPARHRGRLSQTAALEKQWHHCNPDLAVWGTRLMTSRQPSPEEIEQAIRQLGARPAEEAIPALTLVANRAIVELHRLAREQANARRGQPDWGQWARLANAVRSGVLQVAAIRDSVKRLDLEQPPRGRIDPSPPDHPSGPAAP